MTADTHACPFCGTSVQNAPVGRALAGSITRAAIVVAAALSAAACSDDSNPTPTTDAGVDAAEADGGMIAMYGGPPVDASVVDAADSGGPVAAYGAPSPEDAGPDTGAVAPAYGSPSP